MGQRIRRREDPRFLRGEGRYVDDLQLPGALHATFVRSYMAHANITGIDKSAAEAAGAQVFTASGTDLGAEPAPPMLPVGPELHRPFLARDTVRFVGDIVAVVLADTREASVDAAELVAVEYDALPAVVDPMEAVKDEVLLFPEVGTNICFHRPADNPDPSLLESSDVRVSGRLISQRISALPIEPRSSAAQFGEDGRLTMWISSQTPHQDKAYLGGLLGLDEEHVRVVAPDVGGGFGAKGARVEDVILGWLARATGHPVRWTETRSENMVALQPGRAMVLDFELGSNREGVIDALKLDIIADAGAYPGLGAFLPNLTALMSSGVYKIPKIEVEIRSVLTNTTPTGPVRGAGRPEATQMLERAMDLLAAEVSVDPAEIRRRNFIPNDAFPYTTAAGANYDIGDYGGALNLALESAGYDELRREQASRRQNGNAAKQLGIGLSVYVEVTNGISEQEFGAVEITPSGEAIVRTGSLSQGQGHETTFAQIVAERLGLPVEKVMVIRGDTDVVPRGTGTYGSKSTQIGGVAAAQASEEVVEKGKALAAAELEANPEDMVLNVEQGHFHVTGAPQPAISWGDLASRLEGQNRLAELAAEVDFAASQPTFPFGAHVAVVEVDTETGAVHLKRMLAVDDAGRIINPLVAEGQVHGGVVAGIAQALFEELAYDADGNPQNANLVTYCIPAASELPAIEVVNMETPTPINPLGVKGIGESGTIGATPAVHNAVIDALSPFGVRHIDMPLNGETVWRAVQDARQG
ncbi:MAG TPA: xanthine dehydrogenase family protein molybdopterin-binding subunit [Solirubrobacteraceae bacterium]|nr:xanthine dehydrogenase family protein molybdopterin-binding subunit [Solirubrobacteraceae bacterium]